MSIAIPFDNKVFRIALVGSPNSGKTTLFNALTGSRQKTGNYPGVTVERKEGQITINDPQSGQPVIVSVLDLPGLYSLNPKTPDEFISSQIIRGEELSNDQPQLIIAVADSTNLERNLYLVTQLRELGLPMVLALTMQDLARKAKLYIDVKALSSQLGIPVIETAAPKGEGLQDLIQQIQRHSTIQSKHSEPIQGAKPLSDSSEVIQARYKYIESIIKSAVRRREKAQDITAAIDKIVLHRILGPVLLFFVFAVLFQLIFSGAKLPMDFLGSLIESFAALVKAKLPPGDFTNLIADGIVAGVGSVVVFLPQILILFTFILFFEDSGYMARAAFILDRLMSKFGLNGRAFIPLLSSFACAVPGIMATRTIESKRDRLITIMVSPLMTCSARIPVYTLLIGAFIPTTPVFSFFTMQGLVMLGLYIFAILSALLVSWVMGRTVLQGESSSFMIELPSYKVPSFKNIAYALYDRSLIFLKRAGTTILGIAVILWALATFPKTELPEGLNELEAAKAQLENSYLGRAGKFIEPAVKPLGYDWKIGVGILSSFAAREVILSTLGTVYAVGSGDDSREALASRLKDSKDSATGQPVFTVPTVLSLLVFYMLACQCISTLAITRRETNSWRWPALMFAYMTVLAYGSAWLTYRLANAFFS